MGDPPYEDRRKSLITKAYLNIMSFDDLHPAKISLQNDFDYQYYQNRIKPKQKPFYCVAQEVIQTFDIDTKVIYKQNERPQPPWHLLKPNVSTQLHNIITKKDLPHLIKSEGDILIDTNYNNYIKIYTDGSKEPDSGKSSCAYVIPEFKIKKGYRLQNNLSVFTCELMAIFLALNWIQDVQPLNVVIFVDSLSALQAIQGPLSKVNNLIIYDIYYSITTLLKAGINVVLEWIPSHVGIWGNELADMQAKHALNYELIYAKTTLYKEDIKTVCTNILKTMWQTSWDSNKKGRHLYEIKKKISFKVSLPKMIRRKETIMYRLRTGYAKLNKHLFKIGVKNSEMCENCSRAPETVKHFLLECATYSDNRNVMLQELITQGVTNFSMQSLLSEKAQSVLPIINFIYATKGDI
ncbi:uncharacterized protein [Mytilus edulis]|uniref:uncharacterized protein n=1 Tax=Mytilus edulis TaxID=6550 RepID=UPI0039EE1617